MDSVSPQNKALIAEIKKDADTRKFGQGGNGLPNLKNFARIISEKKPEDLDNFLANDVDGKAFNSLTKTLADIISSEQDFFEKKKNNKLSRAENDPQFISAAINNFKQAIDVYEKLSVVFKSNSLNPEGRTTLGKIKEKLFAIGSLYRDLLKLDEKALKIIGARAIDQGAAAASASAAYTDPKVLTDSFKTLQIDDEKSLLDNSKTFLSRIRSLQDTFPNGVLSGAKASFEQLLNRQEREIDTKLSDEGDKKQRGKSLLAKFVNKSSEALAALAGADGRHKSASAFSASGAKSGSSADSLEEGIISFARFLNTQDPTEQQDKAALNELRVQLFSNAIKTASLNPSNTNYGADFAKSLLFMINSGFLEKIEGKNEVITASLQELCQRVRDELNAENVGNGKYSPQTLTVVMAAVKIIEEKSREFLPQELSVSPKNSAAASAPAQSGPAITVEEEEEENPYALPQDALTRRAASNPNLSEDTIYSTPQGLRREIAQEGTSASAPAALQTGPRPQPRTFPKPPAVSRGAGAEAAATQLQSASSLSKDSSGNNLG